MDIEFKISDSSKNKIYSLYNKLYNVYSKKKKN